MALVALGAAAVLTAGCMGTRSLTTSRYRTARVQPVSAARTVRATPTISYSRSDRRAALYVPPPPPPPAWPSTVVTRTSRAPGAVTYVRPAVRPVPTRVMATPAPVRRVAPMRRSAPRVQKKSAVFGCLDGT